MTRWGRHKLVYVVPFCIMCTLVASTMWPSKGIDGQMKGTCATWAFTQRQATPRILPYARAAGDDRDIEQTRF